MREPTLPDRTNGPAIGAAYQDRLTKALASRTHEATLAPEAGLVMVEATCAEATLAALVDPETLTIRRAAYRGAASPVHRGLLEALCEILVDRPVLECSDHAAIYLEHALRDPSRPKPVPGIVLPENADPAFRLPARLVRVLAHQYWAATGSPGPEQENFFDPPASSAWRALNRDERLQTVQRALADICTALRLPEGAIAGVAIEGATRIFLDLVVDMPSGAKGALLMTIEAALKERIEPTLHVYTVERKDRNKIRRLAGSQSGSPVATAAEGGGA